MKTLVAFSLIFVSNCTSQDNTSPCRSPQKISVDQRCYKGNGLALTASEYGTSPSSFEWSVYALKDTAQSLGFTPQDLKIKINTANELIIPDSLATNNQRLIVTVATNCQGELKRSIYYAFIKTQSATDSCTVWQPQHGL
ncbi:hypothetical protein [Spirosoma linguale]|uniref:Uncharacterized protein n=1 Tax=Spirosoma linguale (strain ATCC 33905 / DSM 74 / LMG 10896 / Claus 1) TaxID=504472 RepID=D2QMA2_SPILD|nr:hypothetical protein Slin_3154 [Spirosoma linguale DSM 74]